MKATERGLDPTHLSGGLTAYFADAALIRRRRDDRRRGRRAVARARRFSRRPGARVGLARYVCYVCYVRVTQRNTHVRNQFWGTYHVQSFHMIPGQLLRFR